MIGKRQYAPSGMCQGASAIGKKFNPTLPTIATPNFNPHLSPNADKMAKSARSSKFISSSCYELTTPSSHDQVVLRATRQSSQTRSSGLWKRLAWPDSPKRSLLSLIQTRSPFVCLGRWKLKLRKVRSRSPSVKSLNLLTVQPVEPEKIEVAEEKEGLQLSIPRLLPQALDGVDGISRRHGSRR